MKTHFLSQQERERGRKHYFSFALFNGLGFGFLADTTIYLLAIHFGASNVQLGYISSLMYLSGVILVVTPRIVDGRSLIGVFFWAWFLRGLVGLINALVLFASGQAAVAVVMASYTLFCLFRTVGVSLNNPVVQMLSTPSNLGNMLTHNTAYFNFGSIFGRIFSFVIVSIESFKGLAGLLILQAAGFVFNTVASLFIRKIPCREKVDIPPGQNVWAVLVRNVGNRGRFLSMLLYWNYLSLTVFIGFTIPLLKKVSGLPQNLVFLYTLVTATATTLSMYMTRPFIDRVRSRPFIVATCVCDVVFFAAWAFVLPSTPVALLFVLGFVSMFTKGVNQSMIAKNMIFSTPPKEHVTYNSMINFVAGLFALLFGFAAGFAADAGESFRPSFANQYYLVFLTASALSLTSVFLSLLIVEKEDDDFPGAGGVFTSFENLKSLIDVHYLDKTEDPDKRQTILMSLKYNSAPFALKEIRNILKNPLSSETEEVLKSLFSKPRPKLLPAILDIANDPGSYHRATAVFALGAYPDRRVEERLVAFLDDPSPRIRSSAAKSLARVRDNTVWESMNYVIAILTADKEGPYLRSLFDVANAYPERSSRQALFSIFARMLSFSPALNGVFQKENVERCSGLRLLLDEARQIDVFYRNSGRILEAYAAGDHETILNMMKESLGRGIVRAPHSYIRQAILDFDAVRLDETNALAIVYFGFQALLGAEDEAGRDTSISP